MPRRACSRWRVIASRPSCPRPTRALRRGCWPTPAPCPSPDASIDVATSSFVLQLVDDRPAVLREIRRVLRPGGGLRPGDLDRRRADRWTPMTSSTRSSTSWGLTLRTVASGLRARPTTRRSSRPRGAGRGRLRGHRRARRRAAPAWTREAYLEFKEHYDDRDAFESLDDAGRARSARPSAARWAELPDDGLHGAAGRWSRPSLAAAVALGEALARLTAAQGLGGDQAAKGVASSGRQTLQGR